MRRMLCTDCGRTAPPRTWIGGSDALELLGWLCLGLPGLAYCWWRHASRRKICAHCGSSALVREARGAGGRSPGAPAAASRRGAPLYARRHLAWMGAPGDRLRPLRSGSALVAVGVAAWAVLSLDRVAARPQAASPLRAARPVAPAAPGPEDPAAAAAGRLPAAERSEEGPREGDAARRAVRLRECRRLCTDFHAARSHALRRCLDRCAAQESGDTDPGATAAGPVDPCAHHPDPVGCRFELGPVSVR